MKLSIVIPAHNEEANICATVSELHSALTQEKIEHELVVVDDHCTDRTAEKLLELGKTIEALRVTKNLGPGGFGLAVRWGLKKASGDYIAIYMADASDCPQDVIRFYRTLISEKVDAVFGTRFHPSSSVTGYPLFKLVLNRIANKFIQLLFGLRYNDVTNAFKMYNRKAIQTMEPLLSHHFNLTVEMPLKTIIRGHTYAVIPNNWRGRTEGYSKLSIKEMGSRYLFIILYCFLEKWLSRGDYLESRLSIHADPIKPIKEL